MLDRGNILKKYDTTIWIFCENGQLTDTVVLDYSQIYHIRIK